MDTLTKIKIDRISFEKFSSESKKFISEYQELFEYIDVESGHSEFFFFDTSESRIKYKINDTYLFFDLEKEVAYHRHKRYIISKEPLAKSLGVTKEKEYIIWDATAGTLKDSILILEFFKFHQIQLCSFERNPIVFLLLTDALRCYPLNLLFYYGDSLTLFNNGRIKNRPDVIYYDPMYPEKKKSALSRKEMEIFKNLIGKDQDTEEFLNEAMKISKDRIVVKRPLHAESINNKMVASYKGKSTRYDMYKVF